MLVFLDDLIAFSGPLGDLGPHRHAAPAIICGLDRPVTIRACGHAAEDAVEHASAYIPPGLWHRPDFGNGRAFVLYLALGSAWARRARISFAPDRATGLEPWRWPAAVAGGIAGRCEDGGHRLRLELTRLLPDWLEPVQTPDLRVTALLQATQRSAGRMPAGAVSQSRLRHLFASETQVPFRRHRVWRRLETAMRLALAGQSLTAAAHEAGFADSAHLSRAFRDMFGLSPSQVLRAASGFHDHRTEGSGARLQGVTPSRAEV